jgi:hypothetical protein
LLPNFERKGETFGIKNQCRFLERQMAGKTVRRKEIQVVSIAVLPLYRLTGRHFKTKFSLGSDIELKPGINE